MVAHAGEVVALLTDEAEQVVCLGLVGRLEHAAAAYDLGEQPRGGDEIAVYLPDGSLGLRWVPGPEIDRPVMQVSAAGVPL